MIPLKRLKLTAAALIFMTASAGCHAIDLKGTIWEKAVAPSIEPSLLYAVALVETRKARADGMAAPRPYVLRIGSSVHEFSSYDEASKHLAEIIGQGVNPLLIDIGMMQINPKWHSHRVEHLSDLLIPSIAIRVASEILTEAMNTTDNLVIGVGRYHSYRPDKAQRYGRDVIQIACKIGWKNQTCPRIIREIDRAHSINK